MMIMEYYEITHPHLSYGVNLWDGCSNTNFGILPECSPFKKEPSEHWKNCNGESCADQHSKVSNFWHYHDVCMILGDVCFKSKRDPIWCSDIISYETTYCNVCIDIRDNYRPRGRIMVYSSLLEFALSGKMSFCQKMSKLDVQGI